MASDTLENLSGSVENARITNMTVRAEPETLKGVLSKIDGITEYEITETKENGVYNIKITVEADADIRDELFGAFARLGAPVYKLAPETVSLEEMFLRLTNTVTPEEIEEELSDNSEDVYYEYDEIDGDEDAEDNIEIDDDGDAEDNRGIDDDEGSESIGETADAYKETGDAGENIGDEEINDDEVTEDEDIEETEKKDEENKS